MTENELDYAHRRPRRWPVWLGIGVVMLLVGAGVGWAGATVLTPAEDVLDSTAFTHVEVVTGEVGSSIQLNTAVEWTPVPVGTNQAAGTVTGVNVAAGDEVKPGSVLYTVDLRPIVIAEGPVPAFRVMGLEDVGADVQQLQQLLTALGVYDGQADGEFGYQTRSAVKAWQDTLGVTDDGVVQLGDVVFVPDLPTRVALDTTVVFRGATVSGGEAVVKGLPVAPEFTIPVSDSQAQMMPNGTQVEIMNGDTAWDSVVVDQVSDPESGSIQVMLAPVTGDTICADECGVIPVTGQTLLSSRIVTVETVEGLVVPSAALLSGADGVVSVTDDAGVVHPVQVVASARGMSVIDGVDAGVRVRVPAESK